MTKTIHATINHKPVAAPEGSTILQAARRAGAIPSTSAASVIVYCTRTMSPGVKPASASTATIVVKQLRA